MFGSLKRKLKKILSGDAIADSHHIDPNRATGQVGRASPRKRFKIMSEQTFKGPPGSIQIKGRFNPAGTTRPKICPVCRSKSVTRNNANKWECTSCNNEW